MKIVNTQIRTEEPLTWDEIKELITTGIYEEDFIVLFDKKSENYIQMAEDEQSFVVESRVYDGGNFTHYRTLWKNQRRLFLSLKSISMMKA